MSTRFVLDRICLLGKAVRSKEATSWTASYGTLAQFVGIRAVCPEDGMRHANPAESDAPGGNPEARG